MKKYLKIVLMVMVVCLFASCGEKKEPKTKKLERVDVVLGWYPNAFYNFLYTGIEKGYFKDEGIDVKIHFPSGTGDSLALVASKKADIGFSYFHRIIIARANEDVPVKVIAAITQKSVAVVMALSEKHITRPKDLEGKVVGYSGGPLTESAIGTMMKNDGADPNKVKLVDVGFELLSSMITKKVDATIGAVVNHEVPVMKDKGFDVTYFYPTQFGVPNYYESLLIANTELIQKRKTTYTKFLKACVKGALYVRKHPEEAVDILLANQAKEEFPLTKKIELESTMMLLPVMFYKNTPFLHQDEAVWQENIDWMYDNGIIKTKPKASSMFINLYEEPKKNK